MAGNAMNPPDYNKALFMSLLLALTRRVDELEERIGETDETPEDAA
jgi:hypothetical protein